MKTYVTPRLSYTLFHEEDVIRTSSTVEYDIGSWIDEGEDF